jgi:hypothetical protein
MGIKLEIFCKLTTVSINSGKVNPFRNSCSFSKRVKAVDDKLITGQNLTYFSITLFEIAEGVQEEIILSQCPKVYANTMKYLPEGRHN